MTNSQQEQKLKELLNYVATASPFYKDLFKKNSIDVKGIQTLADLSKLPFTTKKDLQEKNTDFICVPRNMLIDHVTTSGTTSKPVTLSLTDRDLERLAENEYQSFKTAGVTKNDVIQLMTTMDRRFMAGLAYFLGARKLGAGIIRVGNGLPELQWETILSMNPTVIIGVPSFFIKLIAFAEEKKIALDKCSVKKAICIGEAIRNPDFSLNALGKKISEKWKIDLFCTYASSEMATAFTECQKFCGGHQQDELIITEIVNENGKAVANGEPGELVVTPLGIEGVPLIRFKTGDICVAHHDPCACGRTSLRLSPVIGRKNQMIKYRGTTLYPNALYDILENITEIENYQVEASTNDLGTDEINIHIGAANPGKISVSEISDTFRSRLRVLPKLNFLSPAEVHKLLYPANNRKPLLFLDNRKT